MSTSAAVEGARFSPAPGCVATDVALKIADGLSEEQLLTIVNSVLHWEGAVHFWIGDALEKLRWAYGERYAFVREQLDMEYREVKDWIYVAKNVPPAIRRPKLSWSHHREVAKLLPEEQEAWLIRAEAESISVHALREQLRDVANKTGTTAAKPTSNVVDFPAGGKDGGTVEGQVLEMEGIWVNATVDDILRWEAAAEADGLELRDWVIRVCNAAAGVEAEVAL